MSSRTKRRRRRRRAVAGLVRLLRAEPRRDDLKYAAIAAKSDPEIAALCFYADHHVWEMAHMLAIMTSSYDRAYAIVHPQL